MALLPTTGNPPAVTHDQIEAWTKLADDVTAALSMGGQQGLDFLINLMAEWCEAVDDVNTARQICVDFANRGLRHQALEWHAEGFFDVADRLDPGRPGWEAWEESLREQDIVIPRVDPDLREMANRIHEELDARDPSGRSLADYLAQLRRNMLLRGHLGERLTILESIRGLDPAGGIWREMISPIRRRRVDVIADEVKAAIARRDFPALASLRAEVASQDWGDDLSSSVAVLLEAVGHCETLAEIRSRLSQTAATIIGQFDKARHQAPGSPGVVAASEAAAAARRKYAELRGTLAQVLRGAEMTPETAAIAAESGIKDAARQLDAALREPCSWLDQQEEAARVRVLAGDINASLMRQIETAPARSSSLEDFKVQFAAWRRRADDCLEKSRKAAARLPGGVPEATEEICRKLLETRQQLEGHVAFLKGRETRIVMYFLVGLGVVILLIVAVVVAAVLMR